MKWIIVFGMTITLFVVVRAGISGKRPELLARNFGAEVRNVFATKCAGCHGPDLQKPEGRFGYVLDLGRIAANPQLVTPYRPDESELWILVRNGEMPPADSTDGPLTDDEKKIIRAWIEAGALDDLVQTKRVAPYSQSGQQGDD